MTKNVLRDLGDGLILRRATRRRRRAAGGVQRRDPPRSPFGRAGRAGRRLDARPVPRRSPHLCPGRFHHRRGHPHRRHRLVAQPDPPDLGLRRHPLWRRPARAGGHPSRLPAARADPRPVRGDPRLERRAGPPGPGHHRHPLVLPPVRLRDGSRPERRPGWSRPAGPQAEGGRAGALPDPPGHRGRPALHRPAVRREPETQPGDLCPRPGVVALRAAHEPQKRPAPGVERNRDARGRAGRVYRPCGHVVGNYEVDSPGTNSSPARRGWR